MENWERPTNPEGDISFRHGLLMREVEELKERVGFLERSQRRSMRPQQIQVAGISVIVASVVTGIVQAIMNVFHTFGH